MRLQQRVAALFAVLVATTSWAQIRSSGIVGSVVDSSGAAVVAAQVAAVSQETKSSYTTASNEAGQFTLPYLQHGRYTVTVTKEGFKTAEITGVELSTAETVRVPVRLEVGAVSTSIEVSAEAAGIEVESVSMQGALAARVIESLPNINDNPFYYATLQPGVVGRASLSDTQSVNSFGIGIDGRRTFSAISVNGGQAFTNDIQVDGVSVQGSAWNEAAVVPNRDSLQEVRTITNNFSAEYGRAQGVIQMATKSGTSQYHGTLFDRVRNDAFTANSFRSNNRGIPRTPFKVNTFGGTIGGPVGNTGLYFFTSYEGFVHHKTIEYVKQVPDEYQRIGDFSGTRVNVSGTPTPVQIFDPFSATETGRNVYARTPIPNAIIPASRIDPYMKKFMSYYPLPNRAAEDQYGANNYLYRPLRVFHKNSVNSRLDYRWGKHSLYGTGGLTKGLIDNPSSWGPDNPFNSRNEFIGRFVTDQNPYGAIGDTFVISPTLVMDVRYGINRIQTNSEAEIFRNFDYDQFGIPKDILAINALPGRRRK